MVTARCRWAVLIGFSSLVLGCVETPGAERIVGPDGTHMLHVHCGDEQAACFQLAGESCPSGYDLSPIFDPHDGNFLVRCRNSPLSGTVTTAHTPARAEPTARASSPAPQEEWPPAEVALPAEPWPASSSASALPPAPRTATGAVDIGY
ncbi:MAG: hypothetical protein ABI548_07155 [Polyangiaceae bacterium]